MEVSLYYINKEKEELKITYNYINSPFGEALVMLNNNKLCYLGFVNNAVYNKEDVLNIAKKSFSNLQVTFNKDNSLDISEEVFYKKNQNILLIGTPFQISVWQSLLKIKQGQVISYESLSKQVQGIDSNKNYTRAVANAVAKNKISYIVPCHRVISKNGSLHNYLWGKGLKRQILQTEGININK